MYLNSFPLVSTAVVKVVDRQQNVARTICFLKRGDSFGVSRNGKFIYLKLTDCIFVIIIIYRLMDSQTTTHGLSH